MIELKGIAWNHSRGFTSVVATAQRFEELNPGVRISWEKRSLQALADASLEQLSEAYDLLVMDHPHVALAAEDSLLLPYDDYLSEGFLKDQAEHSVGGSHPSYHFAGKQWTLAIDAAAPIATWRKDLMEERGLELPQTWDDMLALARKGQVGFAAIPIDLLMHTYSLCDAHDGKLFASQEQLADESALTRAIEMLKEAVSLCDPVFQTLNPIQVAEKMTTTDDVAYCPLGYGYSNYSRGYYAKRRLVAGDVVSYQGKPLRTSLGGAGMAVSAKTRHREDAMRYAGFTASPDVQRGVFYHAGGQPGHRSAWLDDALNADSGNYFRSTLATLDRALLRPQYHGYMYFQDHGSPVAYEGITGKTSVADTVAKLNAIYRESFKH